MSTVSRSFIVIRNRNNAASVTYGIKRGSFILKMVHINILYIFLYIIILNIFYDDVDSPIKKEGSDNM